MESTPASRKRIASLDILKGLIIVIMALDHTRDYFHFDAFLYDPTDPVASNLPTFITRWITHYCAPGFALMAGVSAYLVGQRKPKAELSKFLLKRGIWLIFVEIVLVTFGWFFDPSFQNILLGVIWVLGLSMVFLAAIIYMPRSWILAFSLIMIFGHNLLDGVENTSFLWGVLHVFLVPLQIGNILVMTVYPLIPWVAVMSLGYWIGAYFGRDVSEKKRLQFLYSTGIGAVVLFFIIRGLNGYGNAIHWEDFGNSTSNLISFMAPLKYPPSLAYLLMTLGPLLITLALFENLRGWLANFFIAFGQVPFFFYIVHIYFIHLLALILAEITGFGWEVMIVTSGWVNFNPPMTGYGVNLFWTYMVWAFVVLTLYPLCIRFGKLKHSRKDQWWWSYL
jgi:uncharacterized membrane protein